MNSYIKTSIEEGIGYIIFYHEKSNSFPSEQLVKLQNVIKDLGENPEVKVIILKSKGDKVFSAGASFDELLTIQDEETGKKFFSGFSNVILAMKNCPKFIIGCIQGKSVGGGVGLAAACDYSLAHQNASIRLSELSIGIGPFVIEPAVTRKIGINAFSELTLNPEEWVSAEWCQEKGFFNKVFDNNEKLEIACLEMAKQLSFYSPEAMKYLKTILWKNTEHWDIIMPERAAMSGKLVLSDFTKETLRKFKSK